ncbi:hypothetical protein GF373_04295, partial [bacterium]|nr:hypothetical protein [bacterium]
MFKRVGIIAILICSAVPLSAAEKNVDVPTITSTLQQRDGAEIRVRFQAMAWDDVTMGAIKEQDDVRQYYNENVFSKMGILTTNVQLQIGANLVDPGSYYIGVLYKKSQTTQPDDSPPAGAQPPNPPGQASAQAPSSDQWFFAVMENDKLLFHIPVPMKQLAEITPYLSFVFRPGITSQDFILTYMYGPYITSLQWTIKGVPSLEAIREKAEQSVMPLSTTTNGGIGDMVMPSAEDYANTEAVTSATASSPKQRRQNITIPGTNWADFQPATAKQPLPSTGRPRGIGAFKRLFKSGKELRGKLN